MVDIKDKMKCIEMSASGMNSKQIFNEYYSPRYPDVMYESFARSLRKWKNRMYADTSTLVAGTYPSFEAHGATVQVNSMGEVVQAWVKQHSSSVDMSELISVIKENTPHVLRTPKHHDNNGSNMLEIPLYDMHFPMSQYEEEMDSLISIITKYQYDEINIIIGQDLFHNDDFRGRTSSGRSIERVDMIQAWQMAEEFWYNIIYYALDNANRVNLIYSKGNHDESLAWAFIQRLEALFPDLNVDDTMKQRKCIYWKGCFIGITHGYTKKNADAKSLRSQFTIEYPKEYAESKVREIHTGHLHREEASDLYGVTVRRLSTSVPTDEWSEDEGYVGAHKRFMIFEWSPSKLECIHFI